MTWLSITQLPLRTVRFLSLVVWAAAIVAAVVLIVRTQDYLHSPHGVFPTYFTAASLVARGESVADFYDDQWFMNRVTEFAPGVTEIHNANPPLLGFFFLPLTPFSYDAAQHLMSAFGFAALVAAGYLTTTELRITGVWRAAGFLAIFIAAPSPVNLGVAQVYPVVLLALVLAWRAWRKGREEIGGSLIGMLLCFKTAALFLWPLMVLERRWRALAAGAATVAVLALVTLPFVGIDGWAAYFDYAAGMIGAPHLGGTTYISIPGIIRNFFIYNAIYNQDPYFDSPALARVLEISLFIAISALAAWVATTSSDHDVTYALFVLVSLVLVPVTDVSHLCLAFLPAFIIFSRIRERLMSPLGVWFFLGGTLSFAPGYQRLQGVAAWGGPIFFYPRLAGLIILMGILVLLGLRSRRTPAGRPLPGAVRA